MTRYGDPKPAWRSARQQDWWYLDDGTGTVLLTSGERPSSAWVRFMPVLDTTTGKPAKSPLPDTRFIQVQVIREDQPPQPAHPYAPLLGFLPIGGAVAWLLTGDWRWAVLGLLALAAVGVVGATADGARKRGDR